MSMCCIRVIVPAVSAEKTYSTAKLRLKVFFLDSSRNLKQNSLLSLLLTEAVQVITLFSKEQVTSCESVPRFLTL
jgi:hypothetical protein